MCLIFSGGILFKRNLIKNDLLRVVYLLFSLLNLEISISHIFLEVLASKKLTFLGKDISLTSILLKPISLSNLILLTESCIPYPSFKSSSDFF